MSSKKIKRTNIVSFAETWIRILSVTKIKTFKQLAETVGVTGPSVSARKEKNEFPVEWGFMVAQKYGLSTDWLLTGEGERAAGKSDFLSEVQKWVDEQSQNNEKAVSWFEYQFEKCFPDFVKWKKRNEESFPKNNKDRDAKSA